MLNIIICGAPGSGKGTQSELLVARFGLKHLSTGDLLREEMGKNSPIGQEARHHIEQGQLVPDEMIARLLAQAIDKAAGEFRGLILDGFPRTVTQAEMLEEMLKARKLDIGLMIDIDVPEAELIDRLLKRGESSGRSDDNIDTIRKRLCVYHEKTKPVSDFYRKQNKYAAIDGTGSIDQIQARIVKALQET